MDHIESPFKTEAFPTQAPLQHSKIWDRLGALSVIVGASGLLFCAFQARKTLGPKALLFCPLAIPPLLYVKKHSFGAQPQSLDGQFDFKKFVHSLDPVEGAKVKSLSLPEILSLRAWNQQEQLRLIQICPNLERIDLTSCPENLMESVVLALEEHKHFKEIFITPDQYNKLHIQLFLTQSRDRAPVLTDEALEKHQARFSCVTSKMIGDNFDLTRFPQLRYLFIDKKIQDTLTVKELVENLKKCPHFISLSVTSDQLLQTIYKRIEHYLDHPSPEHEGLFLLQHLSAFSQGFFKDKDKKFLKALEDLPPSCSVQFHYPLEKEQALQIASKFKKREYHGWWNIDKNTPLYFLLSRKIPEDTPVNDEDAALLLQTADAYEYPMAINCLQEWVSDAEFSLEQLPPRVQFALAQLGEIKIDENFFPKDKREALVALLKKAPHLKKMEILTDFSQDPQFLPLWEGFSFDTLATQANYLSRPAWEMVTQKLKPRYLQLEHPEGTHDFVPIYSLLNKDYICPATHLPLEFLMANEESYGTSMTLRRIDNS